MMSNPTFRKKESTPREEQGLGSPFAAQQKIAARNIHQKWP
jgi:hypothetical protein